MKKKVDSQNQKRLSRVELFKQRHGKSAQPKEKEEPKKEAEKPCSNCEAHGKFADILKALVERLAPAAPAQGLKINYNEKTAIAPEDVQPAPEQKKPEPPKKGHGKFSEFAAIQRHLINHGWEGHTPWDVHEMPEKKSLADFLGNAIDKVAGEGTTKKAIDALDSVVSRHPQKVTEPPNVWPLASIKSGDSRFTVHAIFGRNWSGDLSNSNGQIVVTHHQGGRAQPTFKTSVEDPELYRKISNATGLHKDHEEFYSGPEGRHGKNALTKTITTALVAHNLFSRVRANNNLAAAGFSMKDNYRLDADPVFRKRDGLFGSPSLKMKGDTGYEQINYHLDVEPEAPHGLASLHMHKSGDHAILHTGSDLHVYTGEKFKKFMETGEGWERLRPEHTLNAHDKKTWGDDGALNKILNPKKAEPDRNAGHTGHDADIESISEKELKPAGAGPGVGIVGTIPDTIKDKKHIDLEVEDGRPTSGMSDEEFDAYNKFMDDFGPEDTGHGKNIGEHLVKHGFQDQGDGWFKHEDIFTSVHVDENTGKLKVFSGNNWETARESDGMAKPASIHDTNDINLFKNILSSVGKKAENVHPKYFDAGSFGHGKNGDDAKCMKDGCDNRVKAVDDETSLCPSCMTAWAKDMLQASGSHQHTLAEIIEIGTRGGGNFDKDGNTTDYFGHGKFDELKEKLKSWVTDKLDIGVVAKLNPDEDPHRYLNNSLLDEEKPTKMSIKGMTKAETGPEVAPIKGVNVFDENPNIFEREQKARVRVRSFNNPPSRGKSDDGEPLEPIKYNFNSIDPQLIEIVDGKEAGKLKVFRVDGGKVRDLLDIDFLGGSNCFACPQYVPPGSIFIEKGVSDYESLLQHELAESILMAKGLKYEDAHSIATEEESKFREENPA